MLVRELMNPHPVTITPDADLAQALQAMSAGRTRHLVVMDGDDVVGILSDRDLALYYDPEHMTEERWQRGRVSKVMSPRPLTLGSATDAEQAARFLLNDGVSALPVVDNGTLVGIISERDYVRYFSRGMVPLDPPANMETQG